MVPGPPELRLEAGGKICLILAQNDGTFVTLLRDESVTKLDALVRTEFPPVCRGKGVLEDKHIQDSTEL